MEEVAAVSLNLRNQKWEIIRFELIWCKYFGCSSVEIVVFFPRSFPGPYGLIPCEPGVVIHKILVAIDLVILIDISKIIFSGFEYDSLVGFMLGEIKFVEGNEGRSWGVTTERWIGVLDISQKLVLVAKEDLPDCSVHGEAVEGYWNGEPSDVPDEVISEFFFDNVLEDDWSAKPLLEGEEREELLNFKFRKNFFLFFSKFIQK